MVAKGVGTVVIVPFERETHGRFVYSAYCRGRGEPYRALDRLFEEGARAFVKVGTTDAKVFMGFIIALNHACLHVYVKEALRADGHYIRRQLLEAIK